jgi:lysophospholipase L1-like esterase
MRILIFWDSITEWYYDLENGWWVNRLKTYFWKNSPEIEVANLGINWDETIDIINRLESEIKFYTEKYNDEMLIIFSIWVNDSIIHLNWEEKVKIKDFEKNLEVLYSLAKKYTTKILFIWLTMIDETKVCPFPWGNWQCYKNDRIKQFDRLMKEFCEEKELSYLYLFDLLENKDLIDWIHPNSEGHKKIFEEVRNFLQNKFKF